MITRRTLLGGLGALSAAGMLAPVRSRAAPAPPARRIVLFVTNHGTLHDRWQMPGSASLDGAIDRDLSGLGLEEFSYILQPLHAFRDRLLVVDGLANYGGMQAAFNEHEEGNASCLTGCVPVPVDGSVGVATGPSIDQIIASTRQTPIRSLEYSIGGWAVNYNDAGQPIPYEGDPMAAFRRLFPSGDPDGEPTVRDRVRAHDRRVLELAQARYDALSKRMSSEDRRKLEQHRDLLRDLDAQLAGLAELECEVPPEPGYPSWYDVTWEEEMNRAFFALTRAAFSCGITDVVTIRSDALRNEAIGAPPGDLHNDYAHNILLDSAAADVMADYHRWYGERFAELCAELESVPEEDGTMLDHTLCVWTNELATGDHQFRRVPFVIAGGTHALQTGRYVNFAPERDFAGPWSSESDCGPAHNRMLAALAQAMGMDTQGVGESSYTDWDDQEVDATGVLPGLLADT
jgi:hypothetical protein